MVLGLTQPVTEMSTRGISWSGKRGRNVGLTNLLLSCADCKEILEAANSLCPNLPVRVCIGIASTLMLIALRKLANDP